MHCSPKGETADTRVKPSPRRPWGGPGWNEANTADRDSSWGFPGLMKVTSTLHWAPVRVQEHYDFRACTYLDYKILSPPPLAHLRGRDPAATPPLPEARPGRRGWGS